MLEIIVDRLRAAFSWQALSDKLTSGLINIVVAGAIFLAFVLVWRMSRAALGMALSRTHRDETTITFAQTILKYAILTIGAITALDSAGIKTSAVIASLGIAGLTIGFAAKDALSNLISGLLIFLDRPFVIGDLIEIEGLYGRVDRITLRSTRIVTVDGKMLAVPNTEIINRTVASYSNFPHHRLDLAISIGVNEDIGRARALLLALVKDKSEYMEEPAPRVVVKALNDYNITLELQVWIHNERDHLAHRFALREQMFEALRNARVEMPFQTVQLAPTTVRLNPEA